MKLEWLKFKNLVDSIGLTIQYIEEDTVYYLKAFNTTILLAECDILKIHEDCLDFEANYKTDANKIILSDIVVTDGEGLKANQFDTDGAQIVRVKAAKKGWSFWALPIEITTSTIGASVYAKDSSGTDVPGITGKIYNSGGVEITVPGILDVNLGTCTKTVIDFEPEFDYELIGGSLSINSNPAVDARLWIVGAPDISVEYGGSKEFCSGINLKFLAPDTRFEVDGRVTKYITYNSSTHTGKLRIILKHPAGTSINMQIILHTYKA